jgi:hypothetical protein
MLPALFSFSARLVCLQARRIFLEIDGFAIDLGMWRKADRAETSALSAAQVARTITESVIWVDCALSL